MLAPHPGLWALAAAVLVMLGGGCTDTDSRGSAPGGVSPAPPGVEGAAPDRAEPRRFFAPDSPWNTPVPADARAAARSRLMVETALVGAAPESNFANDAEWGIALVEADPALPLEPVGCTEHDCGTQVQARVPDSARPASGDGHLAVIDRRRGVELDMYEASRDAEGRWTAGSRYLIDLAGDGTRCAPGEECKAATAAGFALTAGVVRPDEIRAGRIEHALAVTVPLTRRDEKKCPASDTDGTSSSTGSVPIGSRVQLDPTFDVGGQRWPPWIKVLARAFQEYGALVVDTGGSLAVRGVADQQGWKEAGVPLQASLAALPWGEFRVLAAPEC